MKCDFFDVMGYNNWNYIFKLMFKWFKYVKLYYNGLKKWNSRV